MADNRIEELRRRLERDPGSRLFAQLAEEHRKAGDHAEAIKVARAGLAVHPAYPSARLTLGRALLDAGDAAGARVELAEVLREAPDNILASRFLGQALEMSGDVAGALQQYAVTLKMAPGDRQLEAQMAALRARSGQAGEALPARRGPVPPPLPSRPGAPALAASPRAAPAPPAIPAAPPRAADRAAVPSPPPTERMPPPAAPAPRPDAPAAPAPPPPHPTATGDAPRPPTPVPTPPVPTVLIAPEPTLRVGPEPPAVGSGPGVTLAASAVPPPAARPAEPVVTRPQPDAVADGDALGGTTLPRSVPAASFVDTLRPAESGPSLLFDDGASLEETLGGPPSALPAVATDDALATLAAPGAQTAEPPTVESAPFPPDPKPSPATPSAFSTDTRSFPALGESRDPAADTLAAQAVPPHAAPPDLAAAPPPGGTAAAAPLSSSTLAELYLRQGLTERAREVYRQVLADDPGNERARAGLRDLEVAAVQAGPSEERAARRAALQRTIAALEALLAAVRRD